MRFYTITRTILAHLAEAGPLVIDALIPPHPKSRLARALLGLDRRRYRSSREAKHTFSSILNRLRREGLVARRGPKRHSVWLLTGKGKTVLKAVRPAPPKRVYHLPPPDGVIRLISFDIPEKLRQHRYWLRAELIACDFEPLHKSVLVGKRALPEELIAEFEARGLTQYVHIVSCKNLTRC